MTQRNPFPAVAAPAPGRWLVLAIVSSALLLIVVDMTVLYTALPRLTHELGVTASSKLWIVNIYALVVSGLLLGMGTLGDRLGHKRLFMMGLAVFGAASLAAAYSPNPAALIAARAVLAVGAAMMMPATLSILRLTFADERERAIAIGVWASVASGGAALGPVIGGILLEHFWWGSVFLINLPIVLLARRYIPAGQPDRQRPWDLIGSLQVMVGLILTAYALKELGRAQPSWLDAALACAGGAAMLFVFARRQRARPHPLIDFAIFRNRSFSSAVAAALFAAAALLGMELVFSQRLQLVLGMSPIEAALYILPLPLAAFIAGPLAGWLLPKVGSARLLFVALLTSGLGMGGYLFSYDGALAAQMASLCVLGVGIGATMTAASSTIMQSATPERAGMAASIEEVSYELGGALGVTLMGSILSGVYAHTLEVPAGVSAAVARDSLDEALALAEGLSGDLGASLARLARGAFDAGYAAVIATAALMLLGTAALVLVNRLRGNNAAAAHR
ncbi:MFS transporter [Achromobacter xylosoxidans]|jgi:DHA2 family multidrug resistance protein-like MFS transporter|uniref:MFS transporter n=1 Tax=Alcaligenes xylosoxydans xylosoxydans TaxID=85698 RepID=UPI0006C6CED6|nr:MFS transporter [Achromobacter xylosoxidans]QQE58867.1 MFS transporter [Achromobacter xylosoxidans]QQV12611.1 MFS transporter [Achromobacter xylosoxidans]UXL02670.1 MFS transporter [Achromobacter xylosoxidans]CUI63449.1 Methyl viologen resistance protein SmvA [Achromobacter xylosoxidans]